MGSSIRMHRYLRRDGLDVLLFIEDNISIDRTMGSFRGHVVSPVFYTL